MEEGGKGVGGLVKRAGGRSDGGEGWGDNRGVKGTTRVRGSGVGNGPRAIHGGGTGYGEDLTSTRDPYSAWLEHRMRGADGALDITARVYVEAGHNRVVAPKVLRVTGQGCNGAGKQDSEQSD